MYRIIGLKQWQSVHSVLIGHKKKKKKKKKIFYDFIDTVSLFPKVAVVKCHQRHGGKKNKQKNQLGINVGSNFISIGVAVFCSMFHSS